MNRLSKIGLFKPVCCAVALAAFAQFATAQSCPSSHPYVCGGACYVDEAQAAAGGCTDGGNSGGNSGGNNGGGSNNNGSCQSDDNPSHVISGRRTEFTQSWCDTNCVTYVGNDTGCLNAAGTFVSNASICSDPANAREAIIDIEYNLGIEVDDQFQAMSGYQGAPPSINPGMTVADATTYFSALIGNQKGQELVTLLNTNGDGWVDRNEASAAKGSDPRQLLNTGFGCGLSTDDIMAYVGLYIGDGAIDKYAGDLDESVKAAMLEFTRSWQPGVNAQACEYRGGCGNGGGGNTGGGNNGGGDTGGGNTGGGDNSGGNTGGGSGSGNSGGGNNNCPASHPVFSAQCNQCFVDQAQAASANCSI